MQAPNLYINVAGPIVKLDQIISVLRDPGTLFSVVDEKYVVYSFLYPEENPYCDEKCFCIKESLWKQYFKPLEYPEIGSLWMNNRKQEIYIVSGLTSVCNDSHDDWYILYRSESWEPGLYCHRTIEEWYGFNREGKKRFVKV